MSLYDRIRIRREALGMSQEELAFKLGYKSRSSINKIELGKADISQSKIKAFADALDTTVAYLMGWDVPEQPIPPGFEPLPKMSLVPRVGAIACGEPILAEQNIETYDKIPEDWRADFTLVCEGDSMEPRVKDGDVVAIRTQPTVENGEIAAVRIDDEATLKHVYHYPDRLVLQPENPAFPPIVLVGEEINRAVIEGKAVGLCRNL